MLVRPAAVAGRFYPADPKALRAEVAGFLAAARPHGAGAVPKAVIAPHAGYMYSGPIAGSAYAALLPLRGQVERVVLLGPAHRVPVRGLAVPNVDAFAGPLGPVPLDREAIAQVMGLRQVAWHDSAHAHEHSLEVQIPFLQMVLGDFKLVPFAVGGASDEEIGEVLDRLWGGDETLIVISSDLSHYHDYATACARDRRTADAIVRGDATGLDGYDACGYLPVRGLLSLRARRGLDVELVDLRNSGDTAGDKSQVVGYGAFLVREGVAHGA